MKQKSDSVSTSRRSALKMLGSAVTVGAGLSVIPSVKAQRKTLTMNGKGLASSRYEVTVDTEDVNVLQKESNDTLSRSGGETVISGKLYSNKDEFSIPASAQIVRAAHTDGAAYHEITVDASASSVSSSVEGNFEVSHNDTSGNHYDYVATMSGFIQGYSDIESDDDSTNNGDSVDGTISPSDIDQFRTEGELVKMRHNGGVIEKVQ